MALISKTFTFSAGATIIASEHNTNLDTIYTAINGNIDNANISATAAIAATKLNLSTVAQTVNFTTNPQLSGTDILSKIYPIGIVVTLGVATNPADLFGIGTWTAIAGKVIFGKSSAGTFNTLDATGGAESANLAHTHDTNVGSEEIDGSGGGTNVATAGTKTSDSKLSATQSILNPYIVKYVWQRTA